MWHIKGAKTDYARPLRFKRYTVCLSQVVLPSVELRKFPTAVEFKTNPKPVSRVPRAVVSVSTIIDMNHESKSARTGSITLYREHAYTELA
jgi:hypothetical protein